MIIKMLIENTKKSCELYMEHGLSMYIETKNHKILFDTGQTTAFAMNADYMDVKLDEVDMAILSHGHYDHSGGWECFFEQNTQANLYVNECAFGSFYSGKEKEIGIPKFLKNHNQVVVTTDYMKLDEGVELFTCNSFERKYGTDSNGLYVKKNGELEEDPFLHEQYLLLTEEEKKVLISGCSHKGIINIVEWFKPDVLVGGFHFKGIEMNEDGKKKLGEYGKQLEKYPTKYYTCHCTGVEQYEYLKMRLKEQVEYLAAGDIVEI